MIRLVTYDEGRHGTVWVRLACRVVRRRKGECRSAYKRRRTALAEAMTRAAIAAGWRNARTHTLSRFDRKEPIVRIPSAGGLGYF